MAGPNFKSNPSITRIPEPSAILLVLGWCWWRWKAGRQKSKEGQQAHNNRSVTTIRVGLEECCFLFMCLQHQGRGIEVSRWKEESYHIFPCVIYPSFPPRNAWNRWQWLFLRPLRSWISVCLRDAEMGLNTWWTRPRLPWLPHRRPSGESWGGRGSPHHNLWCHYSILVCLGTLRNLLPKNIFYNVVCNKAARIWKKRDIVK